MNENSVSGTYKRKRGLRRTYVYVAYWGNEERNIAWHAMIRCDGELKGRPRGIVMNRHFNLAVTIASLVESSIENLIEMVE